MPCLMVMRTMGIVLRRLRHRELAVPITIMIGFGLQRMRYDRECAVKYHGQSGNQHDYHSAHFHRFMSPT